MDDLQLERLKSVCVIIAEGFQRAAEAFRAAAAAFEAEAVAEALSVDFGYKADEYEELLRRIGELGTVVTLDNLEEAPEDIPQHRKMPRPPKRTGPVNKANYTANRPPRVARSSCRTIKR